MTAAAQPTGRLIIVDDEPVILELLSSVFADQPYEIVLCPTGNDAVRAIEDGGVDVLLADKNLPDLSGLDLVQLARQRQPDAETIIITGYASLDTALAAMELGVFDYIVKPPKDIFEVRRKVGQAFEKQAMGRENQRLMAALRDRNGELKTTLAELRSMQAELIQAEKLAGIGTLAAGIAHEISSPLFGVMGLAEAIGEEEDLALVRQYASDIVDYSRSIKDIVIELTGYSRTAQAEYLTTVEFSRVIEDAVRLVVRSTPFPAEQIALDLGEGNFVNARTNEVQQVFVNLVKNAVEAVQEHRGGDGRVEVASGSGDGHVWARVSDNGPGIPKERQSMIFDPFYTTKAPGRGTGLGLNIVYRIVTKYRGTIQVESSADGTIFHVRLPTDSEQAAPDVT